jgi:hypothetical protein
VDQDEMKTSVSIGGGLAVMVLGGCLAWRLLTRPFGATGSSLTAVLGSVLLLSWAAGAFLVWRRPVVAACIFAGAATLPLTPEHTLPAPALLIATSAALAVWSLLASLLPRLDRGGSDPSPAVESEPAAEERAEEALRVCVICHGPSAAAICAACAAILGPQAEGWYAEVRDVGDARLLTP